MALKNVCTDCKLSIGQSYFCSGINDEGTAAAAAAVLVQTC
jgi:hypothetical protein